MTKYYALPLMGGNMVQFEAADDAEATAKVSAMGGDWSLNIDAQGVLHEIKRISTTKAKQIEQLERNLDATALQSLFGKKQV